MLRTPRWDHEPGSDLPRAEPAKRPRTRAGRRAAKRERMGTLPRGLAYLARLLDEPRNDPKFQAFRRYVAERAGRGRGACGRTTALDRARAREYADARHGALTRLVPQRQLTELPAGVCAIVLQLAIASDTSAKTITESLILIGLEAIADDLRANSVVRTPQTSAPPAYVSAVA